jgi:hypothetical protein
MWATGWVRDRALARPRSGDGGNDFVGPQRSEGEAKWWGPVVLDAAPKPASHLAILRERPLPTLVVARR